MKKKICFSKDIIGSGVQNCYLSRNIYNSRSSKHAHGIYNIQHNTRYQVAVEKIFTYARYVSFIFCLFCRGFFSYRALLCTFIFFRIIFPMGKREHCNCAWKTILLTTLLKQIVFFFFSLFF